MVPPCLPSRFKTGSLWSAVPGETRHWLNNFTRLPASQSFIGEFNLKRSAITLSGSHLTLPARWQMVYYSYVAFDILNLIDYPVRFVEWTQGDSNPRPSQCH